MGIDFREWALNCSLSFVRLPFIVIIYTQQSRHSEEWLFLYTKVISLLFSI